MPVVTGVLETALYVGQVPRSAVFYRKLFGFEALVETDGFSALSVAGRQVPLLFRKAGRMEPNVTPGGVIPPHHGGGHPHFAFAIPSDQWQAWVDRLAEVGVPIESVVEWELGGRRLYFRDPDGHPGELATPGAGAIW